MGDIHGDIVKAAAALCAAGVLGEEDGLPIWTGGDTTVVQIGDVLDRGDSEIGERLQPPPPFCLRHKPAFCMLYSALFLVTGQ